MMVLSTSLLPLLNKAAEKKFGYTKAKVVGKNIKMPMSEEYLIYHDKYLSDFLSTGVKKVIGLPNGRRVSGLRKDGTIFPLQFSVSELKTDDQHMFTGIARDLTDEVMLEKENRD
jgi:two-component system, LuxR family, sensor kinase FixL